MDLEKEIERYSALKAQLRQLNLDLAECRERVHSMKRARRKEFASRGQVLDSDRRRRYMDKFKHFDEHEAEVRQLRAQCEEKMKRYRASLILPDPLLDPFAFEPMVEQGRPVKGRVPDTITGKERSKALQQENNLYKRKLLRWYADEKLRLTDSLHVLHHLLGEQNPS
mgnify:CR=1 FL=1